MHHICTKVYYAIEYDLFVYIISKYKIDIMCEF